jgi:membrane associated rhomboid family serine protease/Zn-finger nucleic acid-binding protein
MFLCPRCRERLTRTKTREGLLFVCANCHGRAVGLPVVRKLISHAAYRNLWTTAIAAGESGTPCVVCHMSMHGVGVLAGEAEVRLDVCTACQFVWFDGSELEQLPKRAGTERLEDRMPVEVREKLALVELEAHARRTQLEEIATRMGERGTLVPEEAWHWIPGVLGLPVECENHPLRTLPWLTWTLTAILLVVFLLTYGSLETMARQFGLIPAELTRYGGLTLVTCFFLHGGLLHVLGNTYFLYVFGDNVEDYLGRLRYGVLLAAATVVGGLSHVLADADSTVPCIGASGGISGVIMFYSLRFPHARIGLMLRFFWFYVPAWAALLLWLLLQFVLAGMQLADVSNVSALAHLGGAAAGLAAWLAWRESVAAGPREHAG